MERDDESSDRHIYFTQSRWVAHVIEFVIIHPQMYWWRDINSHNHDHAPVPLTIFQWDSEFEDHHSYCLTNWGWDKMAVSLQTTFSNLFSSMKIVVFWFKFHWSMFPRVQLTISHHWFRYGLALNRHQAIIWTNNGLVCDTYVSLGLNVLIRPAIFYVIWGNGEEGGCIGISSIDWIPN